jgi:hypothetical protein
MMISGEKTKKLEKNCSNANSPTKNVTWNYPRINPRLYDVNNKLNMFNWKKIKPLYKSGYYVYVLPDLA